MWQLEAWDFMLEGLHVHLVQELVQRVVQDSTKEKMMKDNTKDKLMKEQEKTMTMMRLTMSMMRLACPSFKMHPKERKAPSVLDVHRGRSNQWTGTL
jgi:hypothetical protein